MNMQPSDSRGSKLSSYKKGIAAEELAQKLLEGKHYRLLAHRYRNQAGEIDIVAKRGNHIAFVEVKGRKSHDEAAWSILPRQQYRIASAAEGFLGENAEYAGCSASFDVVLVSPTQGCAHIENVFLA